MSGRQSKMTTDFINRAFELVTTSTNGIPVKQAKAEGVPAWIISTTSRIAQRAPDLIEQVKGGELSLARADRLAFKRHMGVTAAIRRASAAKRQAARRSATLSQQGQLWRELKTGLNAFNSLPLPGDVADVIARYKAKRPEVNAKLKPALQWLESFASEWAARQ